MGLFFLSDPLYLQHHTGFGHPEQPARAFVIQNAIITSGLNYLPLHPRKIETNELLLCHTSDYIQLVRTEVDRIENCSKPLMLSTGDVFICKHSYEVAKLAAGGVLAAVDKVMGEQNTRAFCAVRPPGHHACSNRGMGFCLFNQVALAARYAQQKYALGKVLIVDWDVHHGNGTQEIFYTDPSVFYFSTHQAGIYR